MTLALTLAEFVCGTRRLPEPARTASVRAVLDLMSAAVAGFDAPAGIAARRASPNVWGTGPAMQWFSGERLAIPGAAFANSVMASTLDLDDGHRAASGHPGAAVIPAVLATAEAIGADAERILTAIALGYEVGVRIAAARDVEGLHTFDSGLWCGQAVAAATGWLRGLAPEAIANAIAIAGTTAPSQAATSYTRHMGNHVKEGIPWATANGLTAVELAAQGFTGPVDLLDDEGRYDPKVLTDALGEGWLVETVYFKPYSCCRWAHAAIDAIIDIMKTENIATDAIHGIRVDTFGQALTLNNDLAPRTLEGAQYSVPFCVAVAVVRGPGALLPLVGDILENRDVIDFAHRVSLAVDLELDAMFPAAVPARVECETRKGHFSRRVIAPRGEPSNPLSWEDLNVKFNAVVRGRASIESVTALTAGIAALDAGNVGPLLSALAKPLREEGLVAAASPAVVNELAG